MDGILEVLQEKLGEEVFTEEFQNEVKSQLEVIVNEKVQEKIETEKQTLTEKLQKEYDEKKEQLEEKVKQEVAEYKVELDESIDGYLDYAVKEYFQENKVAIQDEFTVKAAKELIEKFAAIIEDNHFTVDVDQKKRLVKMEEKLNEVQSKLNKVIRENIEKKMEIEEYKKSLKFKKLTEGLSKVKIEKVLTLTEGLEFKDLNDFERKVKLCVDRVSESKKQPKEEVKEELTESKKEESKESSIDKYLG